MPRTLRSYSSIVNQDLYLPLDESSGNIVYDKSGNARHGTITGATRTVGIIGRALQFNGVNQHVLMSTFPLNKSFTMMFWVKRLSTTSAQAILSKTDEFDRDCAVIMGLAAGKWVIEYTYYGGVPVGEVYYYTTKQNIPLGTWTHCAGTFISRDKYYIYQNGKFLASGVAGNPNNIPNDTGFDWYSGYNQGAYAFDGVVDDVRVYSRALTAAEINHTYHASIRKFWRKKRLELL